MRAIALSWTRLEAEVFLARVDNTCIWEVVICVCPPPERTKTDTRRYALFVGRTLSGGASPYREAERPKMR